MPGLPVDYENESGFKTVAPAKPGYRWVCTNYTLGADARTFWRFYSGDTPISGRMPVVADAPGGASESEEGQFQTEVGQPLRVHSSATINGGGHVTVVAKRG